MQAGLGGLRRSIRSALRRGGSLTRLAGLRTSRGMRAVVHLAGWRVVIGATYSRLGSRVSPRRIETRGMRSMRSPSLCRTWRKLLSTSSPTGFSESTETVAQISSQRSSSSWNNPRFSASTGPTALTLPGTSSRAPTALQRTGIGISTRTNTPE